MDKYIIELVKKNGLKIIFENYDNVIGVLANGREFINSYGSSKVLFINKKLPNTEKEYYILLTISYLLLNVDKQVKYILIDDIKDEDVIKYADNLLYNNKKNYDKKIKTLKKRSII